MLIKVKYRRAIGLTIPIAFFTIDELLKAVEELIWMLKKLFPALNDNIMSKKINGLGEYKPIQNVSLKDIVELANELLEEVRKHKNLKLIEIHLENVQLMVKLY